MGVTVNGAVLGQAGRVLAAVCLCWICAGEALAQGVCAEVRLRISQEAVMTRSAFKATLELANNSGTATVDNAGVDIYISTLQDCSVLDGNDLFAGDDAMTENVVEPSDPFPLGLIVRNTARGDARKAVSSLRS